MDRVARSPLGIARVESVNDARTPDGLGLQPFVLQDGPERLVQILAVPDERPAQHAFLHGAELPQRAVAAAVLHAARASSRCTPSTRRRSRPSASRRRGRCPCPRTATPSANPHSAVPNAGSSDAHLEDPDRRVRAVRHDREAHIWPACRCRIAQLMKFSKPSSVVGGGEMNFAPARRQHRRAATAHRSCTQLTQGHQARPSGTGRPVRQSLRPVAGACSGAGVEANRFEILTDKASVSM